MILFVSGSISIKQLPNEAKSVLSFHIKNNTHIIIGDAPGIDKLVQEYLVSENYYNVTVYHIRYTPRNKLSSKFKTKQIQYPSNEIGERSKQTFKDKAMFNDANSLLYIWDGKSKGTKRNIQQAQSTGRLLRIIRND